MIDFFKESFEYRHYFNQKLGEAFIENPDKISEKAISIYSHILNAHQIWNNRIDPTQKVFGVWQTHPIQDFNIIDIANFEHSISILDKYDLAENVNYTNSTGQAFGNSIKDILFHVTNHSTYHRAQIATEFKQNGLAPLATDYIFYKR